MSRTRTVINRKHPLNQVKAFREDVKRQLRAKSRQELDVMACRMGLVPYVYRYSDKVEQILNYLVEIREKAMNEAGVDVAALRKRERFRRLFGEAVTDWQ